MLSDTKSIPNAYFFSFRWFLIYLITTPAVFLNQTHLVRLGIFHLELGKKHTFWLWEWGQALNRLDGNMTSLEILGQRNPCDTQHSSLLTPLQAETNYFDFSKNRSVLCYNRIEPSMK